MVTASWSTAPLFDWFVSPLEADVRRASGRRVSSAPDRRTLLPWRLAQWVQSRFAGADGQLPHAGAQPPLQVFLRSPAGTPCQIVERSAWQRPLAAPRAMAR